MPIILCHIGQFRQKLSLCTDSTGLLYRRIVELNSNSF